MAANSAPPRYGALVNASFSCMTGGLRIIYQAINAHASRGSEANTVVSNFEMLSPADQQALVNFLRSL